MCLDSFESVKITNEVVEAWKVFRMNTYDGTLYFACQEKCVIRGKWLKSDSSKFIQIWDSSDNKYPQGFHCWKTLKDAKEDRDICRNAFGCLYACTWANYVILKVRARKIRTIGKQFGLDVFVADELFVPKKKVK